MPELMALRHAKSSWGEGAMSDRERPLAGQLDAFRVRMEAAKRMGRMISKLDQVPDLVLSSPAVRALTTAELASKAGRWGREITVVPSFYGGSWTAVAEAVRDRGAGAERVLVVGHEPTWSELVSVLTGGSLVAMPTAGLSCLSILGPSWSGLGPGCAELLWHVTPRMIKRLL